MIDSIRTLASRCRYVRKLLESFLKSYSGIVFLAKQFILDASYRHTSGFILKVAKESLFWISWALRAQWAFRIRDLRVVRSHDLSLWFEALGGFVVQWGFELEKAEVVALCKLPPSDGREE
jgi:hypothetical protein